jgi:tetratricopeptide (TPR) repeat protein
MNKTTIIIFATLILTLSTFAQPGELLSPTAKAAFDKENYEPCIAELSKIIVREPKNSNAYFERARCYFFGSDSGADFDRLEKIYLSKPNADKSKVGKAVSDQINELRNRADADVEKSIILNPKNASAYNLRGYMKWLSDKNDEAIADYSKAIEIDPKFIKPYFNRGNSKADKQDYVGAIADFTKVIEFDPNNIAALKQRSYAFTSKNKGAISREAITDLLKLAKLEPNNKKHYEIIESLCLNTAYPYTCGDTFKEYIAAKPNSPEGYLGLARSQASVEIYYDLDKKAEYWKTAEDAYLKYIELDPTVIEPYIELFDLYFDKLRSSVNAKVMSVRTLAKFPNDARSYILSGRMRESNGDWATAVKEFSRAIELNPKFSLAYERRSNAYAGLKEEDKAYADLNKAIEIDPNNGSAYLNRGNFHNKLKRYQEAIADFTEADKLKETCAKTYRGILFTTLANSNKEAPNTGNFLNAQRDFLADDAQKCYLTHYMYGLSFYAQGLNSQAAQQFDYALTVYKKHGYTTEKIIEFQNRLKALPASTTSQGTPPKSNSTDNSFAYNFIESFKQDGLNKGFTVVKSGVYDYEPNSGSMWRFDVRSGEFYLFMAVKEVYDPTFGMDIIYDGNGFIRPTEDWRNKVLTIKPSAQYAMQYLNERVSNSSVFTMRLQVTANSNIRSIQFSPAGKVSKIYWVLLKEK